MGGGAGGARPGEGEREVGGEGVEGCYEVVGEGGCFLGGCVFGDLRGVIT